LPTKQVRKSPTHSTEATINRSNARVAIFLKKAQEKEFCQRFSATEKRTWPSMAESEFFDMVPNHVSTLKR
jgi:hypothetical protein